MGLLSEDIDEITNKICAGVEIRTTAPPFAAHIYKASPPKITTTLKEILSKVPIDEMREELIAKHCLQMVDPAFHPLFRFYRLGEPERACADPEVYEFKGKFTKYTKPAGFYIKFT